MCLFGFTILVGTSPGQYNKVHLDKRGHFIGPNKEKVILGIGVRLGLELRLGVSIRLRVWGYG